MRLVLVSCLVFALTGCQREKRDVRPGPARLIVYGDAARQSDIQPGGSQAPPQVQNPSHGSAYEISEGQRLFNWYNCSGCHFNGGGGIGPPLMKSKEEWLYGDEPGNIFDTIIRGRPNGMPAWGGRIPEYQVWQLVTYIGSMNNQEPKSATPVRPDTIEQNSRTVFPPKRGTGK